MLRDRRLRHNGIYGVWEQPRNVVNKSHLYVTTRRDVASLHKLQFVVIRRNVALAASRCMYTTTQDYIVPIILSSIKEFGRASRKLYLQWLFGNNCLIRFCFTRNNCLLNQLLSWENINEHYLLFLHNTYTYGIYIISRATIRELFAVLVSPITHLIASRIMIMKCGRPRYFRRGHLRTSLTRSTFARHTRQGTMCVTRINCLYACETYETGN